MTKGQLIDEIRSLNPTAAGAFLDQFDEAALSTYLLRLREASVHAPRITGWTPAGATVAVVPSRSVAA